MTLTLLLLGQFGLLVGYLIWRRVPRWRTFNIILSAAWIYALFFFLSLQMVNTHSSRWIDAAVPYFLAALPVAFFVWWTLREAKRLQE